MKRIRLAAVALIPLMSAPAHAQLAVVCADCAKEWTQIAGWGKQALDVARQIEEAMRLYHMTVNTYDAIAHATDVRGVASALGGVTRTWMPEAGEVGNLMSGTGQLFGMAESLRDGGRFYLPPVLDTWGTEMERRETVTANAKAIAHSGLESAQTSLAQLGQYLGILSEAQDGTAVSAVGHGVAVEQQNLINHQAQLQQVAMMLATEDRVDRQRQDQKVRKDLDDFRDALTNDNYGNW